MESIPIEKWEGVNVFYQKDIERIAKEIKDQLVGDEEPTHAKWALNKRKCIAHLLGCEVKDLKYIHLPAPCVYRDKDEVIVIEKHSLLIKKSGALISEWTGGDFGDYKYYFVTTRKGWKPAK